MNALWKPNNDVKSTSYTFERETDPSFILIDGECFMLPQRAGLDMAYAKLVLLFLRIKITLPYPLSRNFSRLATDTLLNKTNSRFYFS